MVTGPFVHQDLISLLFSLLSFVPSAVMEENSLGTVPFTMRFVKLSIFINFVYSVFTCVLGLAYFTSLLSMPAMGLWPIIFCDMVIQCYQ